MTRVWMIEKLGGGLLTLHDGEFVTTCSEKEALKLVSKEDAESLLSHTQLGEGKFVATEFNL